MAKQLLIKVRPSASLILLAKANKNNETDTNFDYNALLFTRTAKSSFMPESSVFPGGACDVSDFSPAWLGHFQRYDVSATKLRDVFKVQAPRPDIFATQDNGSIDASLALRLTAIRETFEEVGVLLCRDRRTLTSTKGYAQFYEQFDVAHWQHAIHNDSSKFIKLCEQLDVVPDVWALHEWAAWKTPSTFKKRFVTAFFLTALQNEPKTRTEPNEVKDFAWRSPVGYLQAYSRKELWLPPPQFYELSRFLNYKSLEKLQQFAERRAANGLILIHPVLYKCTDGWVQLMPGDDMYPKDPDLSPEKIETGMSMAEFRAQATKSLHRSEHKHQHHCQVALNFEPSDGHLQPLDPSTL